MNGLIRNDRSLPQTLALAAIGMALLSGCANTMRDYSSFPKNPYSKGSLSDAIGLDGSFQQGDYRCPANPNVIPNGDGFSDDGKYTVCTSPTGTADILIHGYVSGSDTVCVFPAQVVDDSHIYAKPDIGTGLPWNECANVTSAKTGIYAHFPNISFNAVFISTLANRDDMQRCLAAGNPALCPAYSFGKFR